MIARIVTSIRHNAIAWLALFVALTGTSMAASHYVVSSTKQIKPSVLKKLHGNRGPAGSQGSVGPAGPQGAAGKEGGPGQQGLPGKEGKAGKEGKTGPAGETTFGGPTGPTGEAGTNGATGPTGSAGTTGAAGATGATGEAGSGGVKAYAHISDEGEVSESSGFSGATVKFEPKEKNAPKAPEPGVYCISGLSFTPKNVEVTLDANEIPEVKNETTKKLEPPTPTPPLAVVGISSESNCPSGTQVTVETIGFLFEGEDEVEEGISQGFFVQIN